MVLMESVVSGHQFNLIRERLADKIEVIRFDPYSKYPWNYGQSMCANKLDFYSPEGVNLPRKKANPKYEVKKSKVPVLF